MPGLPHSLDSIFHPHAVAVVGASGRPDSVGGILIRNLLENPFGGVVYPINPGRKMVHGVPCYAGLAALPDRADLVVVATPAATVPGVLRDATAHGARAAVVLSAGGRALEAEIRDIARGKMRVVGPNCLGVIHPPSGL